MKNEVKRQGRKDRGNNRMKTLEIKKKENRE
jgi:hypothetical protein